MLKLVLIFWRHHNHVGNMTQEGVVERTVMSSSILSHEAASIDAECHRKILRRHIVHNLIIGPLQKRRIHRDDRFQPLRRKPCRKGHGMLFSNPDVVETIGEFFLERRQACPLTHGCRDGDNAFILTG